MKKILIIFVTIIILVTINNKNNYIINNDSIRFRVIANSNSVKDIEMKEKVVKELSGVLFKRVDSKEKMNEEIYSNLKNIEEIITKLFKSSNYDKNFKISYGKNSFPKKVYRNHIYEEGEYDSLVIEIGSGKGNNYFCFLYPSLCIVDYEEKENANGYSSKIVNIISKLF